MLIPGWVHRSASPTWLAVVALRGAGLLDLLGCLLTTGLPPRRPRLPQHLGRWPCRHTQPKTTRQKAHWSLCMSDRL